MMSAVSLPFFCEPVERVGSMPTTMPKFCRERNGWIEMKLKNHLL